MGDADVQCTSAPLGLEQVGLDEVSLACGNIAVFSTDVYELGIIPSDEPDTTFCQNIFADPHDCGSYID